MGLTRVKVVVKSLETGASREVELIVDTGSTFTWINRRVLEELGVKPRRVRWFKTIDGKVVMREVGVATIRYEEYEADGSPPWRAGVLRPLGLPLTSRVPLTGAASWFQSPPPAPGRCRLIAR